jgi:GR25 family glycosyltransferase involved in LPS biosynthesis
MSILSKVVVLSMPEDVLRKQHISKHFEEIGIKQFDFFEALGPLSKEVISAYNLGLVKPFPGCFRCGEQQCDCANNLLIPQQVANFLSFKSIWESLRNTGSSWTLICEDDVFFCSNASVVIDKVLLELGPKCVPSLVRLSQSGLDTASLLSTADYKLTDNVVMSNSAYLINGHMAAYLCEQFNKIETTSDIWLHNVISKCELVHSYTVEPLLATDLSFNPNFAKFSSRIHPKGIDEADRKRAKEHVKHVSSSAEYVALLKKWVGIPRSKEDKYLVSPSFQMRYMLAAGMLSKFRNILEIGSYRTPIYEFIQNSDCKIVALDPAILDSKVSLAQRNEMLDYRASVEDLFSGEPYALVILGLDLPITSKLKRFIANAEIALLEFSECRKSREVYENLKLTTPFNEIMNVGLDLSDNNYSGFKNELDHVPRTQRSFKVVSAKYSQMDELNGLSPIVKPKDSLDTSDSKLLNSSFISSAIFPEAEFEFSHAANADINYLGGGLLYYSMCHMFRAKVCVCLGTGGAFVPRLMRQAQRDMGLASCSKTIIVDGNMGNFGRPNWLEEGSFFKKYYSDVEVKVSTTALAAEEFKVNGLSIDYLHIDADHSYEGALKDFQDYLPLMSQGSVITFHDTKIGSHPSVTCGMALKDIRDMGFEVVDFNQLGSGVAIIKIP